MQTWLLVLSVWLFLAVLVALLIGRSIGLADQGGPTSAGRLSTADLPEEFRAPGLRTP